MVNRRQMLALLAALPLAARARDTTPPRVAVTMDDAAWGMIPAPFHENAPAQIMAALEGHGNPRAALFVAGRNVDSPEGHALLQRWNDRGHIICNHTWSHPAYNSMEPAKFGEDVLRCDALIRPFSRFRPFFRFPMLKEGSTRERRDWMRAFLHDHGYRNGAVTIDTSDWYYDQRLRERLKSDPRFDLTEYRRPYVEQMERCAMYYDDLGRRCIGHAIPHTILVHFNLLNALFLGDVLAMFRRKGWSVIDAEEAFADPIFRREPDTVPAGESLVWALAKESGRFETELRYPGEDSAYEKANLDRLGL